MLLNVNKKRERERERVQISMVAIFNILELFSITKKQRLFLSFLFIFFFYYNYIFKKEGQKMVEIKEVKLGRELGCLCVDTGLSVKVDNHVSLSSSVLKEQNCWVNSFKCNPVPCPRSVEVQIPLFYLKKNISLVI